MGDCFKLWGVPNLPDDNQSSISPAQCGPKETKAESPLMAFVVFDINMKHPNEDKGRGN